MPWRSRLARAASCKSVPEVSLDTVPQSQQNVIQITSTRRFNASSAGLSLSVGLNFDGTPLYAISFPTGASKSAKVNRWTTIQNSPNKLTMKQHQVLPLFATSNILKRMRAIFFGVIAVVFSTEAFAENTWTQLSGEAPAVRTIHSAVFNTANNRMIMFGGMNGPGTVTTHPLFNDVWVLSNADGLGGPSIWTKLSPTGGPPSARGYHSAAYDAANNRMMVFAGDPSVGFCSGAVNDVWVLTNADGTGGTPNWTQLSPTGGPPDIRQGPTAVYDSATNRLIAFGGYSNACGSLSNAVWVLQNANGLGGTPVWTQLAPAGAPPAPRWAHSAVYDSANNRMVVFGGGANDVWVLQNANGLGGTPSWAQLSPTGTPPTARSFATAVYDPAVNRLVVFGGVDASGRLNDVWVLANANGLGGTPNWAQLSPTGTPPSKRDTHTAVFNPSTNRLVTFAGRTCTGACSGPEFFALNDVWVLSNANGTGPATWTQLSGEAPAVRTIHSAVFNTANNRMIMFGGMNGPGTVTTHPLFNDVWVLSNADGLGGPSIWTKLSPTGGPPSARGYHSAAYDAANNRMMVFAGDPSVGFCSGAVNDVWVLTNADGTGGTPNWTQLSPTGGPPDIRQGPTAVYDSATNRLIAFGGYSNACGSLSNAVWVLQNANGLGGTPVWTQLAPAGAPPAPRWAHSAVYDSANNRMVVFGGGANDVWVLQNANGLGGTPSWAQLSPTGTPPTARSFATAVYDPAVNRLVVFGGVDASGRLNDVWVLANANGLGGTPNWAQLSPTGTPPSKRDTHTAVFNPSTNRLVTFAGRTCTGACSGPEFFALNDVWVLSNANGTALQLAVAASRKTHGGAGTFDINLPLTGEPGVECRSSGSAHMLVFTFSNNLVSGNASLTAGIGSVSGSPTFVSNTMTVNLSGVADVQKITVTLSGVTDSFAQVLPNTAVSMNVLVGDTNGNKTVNATDIGQAKSQSGIPVTVANFRQDVAVNGSISATDIALVKSRSGQFVP